ncbi:MAG: pilus assembly PilX N-terminal domain-containing protein [Candidatus Delongbacteria bacterium]|jgi:hypothetical protein|nr:pilus assembly PilX N-terminal domain-containing protein [Candidatus Delongbacteria bacterium]
MKEKPTFLNNEKGSTLIIAVVFLMLLTILGVFATTTSTIEVQISGNDKINKMVFYAADSGIDYVAVNPDLYGPDNIIEDVPLSFPDSADVNATYSLSDKLLVNGNVSYLGKSNIPQGSGYSAGQIFAINYEIESNSTGPNNGASKVEAGFYRIGL